MKLVFERREGDIVHALDQFGGHWESTINRMSAYTVLRPTHKGYLMGTECGQVQAFPMGTAVVLTDSALEQAQTIARLTEEITDPSRSYRARFLIRRIAPYLQPRP
ncbi:MAG: hypothetical protein HY549_08655 [Elusimicrobia bacterium]|nr:hypothetical protein [Elusimicrobiota bacterium]